MRRSLPTLLLLALIATLLPVGVARAATGDYSVRLTSTSGSHWTSYSRGPFIGTSMRVYAGIGAFTAGDYRSWRVTVPGEGAKVVGGSMSLSFVTPEPAMRVRMVAGTGTATPTVVYESAGDGNATREFSGSHDWVQFDLRSTAAARTTSVAANAVTATSIVLVLRDSVAPTLLPHVLPAPSTWHGLGACAPVNFGFGDQGGGLASFAITRADSGAVVASWQASLVESPRPGPTGASLQPCITAAQRGHGDTKFVARVTDVSGLAREHAFWVRADHVAPAITGGPAEGAVLPAPVHGLEFSGEDTGAGIAQAHATLDGTAVPLRVDGRRLLIDTGKLPLGVHRIVVTLVDGAGNPASVTRIVTVKDVTAPTLTLDSPGARGDQRAALRVRVTDDAAGVDPATWAITADGEPVTVTADGSQASATIGPLSPGMHRFDIRVADRAGNVARLSHAYDVVASDVPTSLNVGTRSGLFLVDRTTTPVTSGRQASTTLYLARNGRPYAGKEVVIHAAGREHARVATDAQGVARLTFVVGAPAAYVASAPGLGFEAVPVEVAVAPRLTLAVGTARPRAGSRVRISGRVVPGLRGRRVVVEARVGGVWYPVRRTPAIGANGRFRSIVVANTRGRIWVRARLAAAGGWAAGTSPARELRVR